MIRTSAICAAGIAAFVLACSAAAVARPEPCPAFMWHRPAAPAQGDGRSSGLVFGLAAESPRTIAAARIVADTDRGWYVWDVSNVILTLRTTGDGESTRSVATFDGALIVRHAWVLAARTSAAGAVEQTCEVPAFRSAADPPLQAQNPVGFPHVAAVAVPAPYATDCPRPFAEASVARAVRATFPSSVPVGSYTSQVLVELGENDDLIDAWVYKGSLNPALDASALAAAKASSYRSPVSYCQKTQGNYLFRVDFTP